jgi:hypothetical protein
MIQDFDMQLAKTDVMMMATVFLVQHVMDTQVHPMRPTMFNQTWMKVTLASLLGFALHGLLTNKISLAAKQALNNSNPGINNAIYDIVKFGTVFVVGEFVSAQLLGRQPDFGTKWQMASGLRIAAYCAFDMVESSLPQVGSMQSLYNILLKVGFGEVLAYYVMDSKLSTNNLYNTMSLLTGFAVYELVGKNLLTNIKLPNFGNISTTMVGGETTKVA